METATTMTRQLFRISLTLLAFAAASAVAVAQDPARTRAGGGARRQTRLERLEKRRPLLAEKIREFQGLTPEQRKARVQELKNLTPEERKARADKFFDEHPAAKEKRDRFQEKHPRAKEKLDKFRSLSADDRKEAIRGLREAHPRFARWLHRHFGRFLRMHSGGAGK
jgi:hypothetical protein